MYQGVFVVDIAVATTSTPMLENILAKLKKKYTMTNFGNLEYFCGISVLEIEKGEPCF